MHSPSPWTQILVGLTGLFLGMACEEGEAPTRPKLDAGVTVARDGHKDGGVEDAALEGDEDAGDGTTSASLRLVGAVEDTDIRLGMVLLGRRARVFFCGGDSTYETATRWFVAGLAADGSFGVAAEGWRATGRLSSGSLRGQWSDGDEQHDFEAGPIRADTLAGLYEGTSECGRIGLIVTQGAAGDEPSAQGACVGEGHLPLQVHPILPVALEDGEIRVEIAGVESRVHPATAAGM